MPPGLNLPKSGKLLLLTPIKWNTAGLFELIEGGLNVCFSSSHHQAKEELRPVKEDFEAKNKQLLDEMPKFYQSRIDYFQPSFEALIRAQVGSLSQLHRHTRFQHGISV